MRTSVLSKCFVVLAMLASYGTAQSNGSISGAVADPSGAVFARVPVELRSLQLARKTETNSLGRFAFTDVPPGDYALVFSAKAFYTKTMRTTVASGEERAVNTIALEIIGLPYLEDYQLPIARILDPALRTGNLVLRVYGVASQALPRARVTLFCRGSLTACETRLVSQEGLIRFEGLDEGRYLVSVVVEGYYQADFNFFVSSGVEHEFRYFLEKCVEPTCDPTKRPASFQLE